MSELTDKEQHVTMQEKTIEITFFLMKQKVINSKI